MDLAWCCHAKEVQSQTAGQSYQWAWANSAVHKRASFCSKVIEWSSMLPCFTRADQEPWQKERSKPVKALFAGGSEKCYVFEHWSTMNISIGSFQIQSLKLVQGTCAEFSWSRSSKFGKSGHAYIARRYDVHPGIFITGVQDLETHWRTSFTSGFWQDMTERTDVFSQLIYSDTSGSFCCLPGISREIDTYCWTSIVWQRASFQRLHKRIVFLRSMFSAGR